MSLNPVACGPLLNQLLATLPAAEYTGLLRQLERVDLHAGQVLCESGVTPVSVLFPTTAVVSLLNLMQDGASTEVAVIGNEGVVGFALIMGGNATPSRAVVQVAGQGYRLPARALREQVERAGPVLQQLLRYTQALIAQVSQTAACNRHHSIDQQLCRRLLLGLDRTSNCELELTHEGMSHLLGVRREGVTAAAQRLREAGVIRYHRGRIAVLDRELLESRSCECYATAKKEYQRLLPVLQRRQVALAA